MAKTIRVEVDVEQIVKRSVQLSPDTVREIERRASKLITEKLKAGELDKVIAKEIGVSLKEALPDMVEAIVEDNDEVWKLVRDGIIRVLRQSLRA